MKAKLTRLLFLAVAVVTLLCGCGKGAQTSTTVSSDGIVAVFTTDSDSYSGTDTAKANLEIINNTGKKVAISTDIKAPNGLKLNLDTIAGNLQMEPGQSVSLSEITVKMNPTGLILSVVLGLLVVIVAVFVAFIIIRKKKTKQVTSMLLCLAMIAGVVMATPIAIAEETEADYAGSLTVNHLVTVDGKEVLIEAVVNYEIGVPEKNQVDTTPPDEDEEWEDPDCNKPNGKVTAFYYNDFDGEKALIDKGATIKMSDQKYDIVTDGDNGYMRCEIASLLADSTFAANFKDNKMVDHFVVHFEISTENEIPAGTYMLYRYTEEKNRSVFSFDKDGNLVLKGSTFEGVKVEKGKWLAIDLVFDLTPEGEDLCTVYANDEKLMQMSMYKHQEFYKIPYMRFHFIAGDNMGKTVLLDNFMIYEGSEILDISEVNCPQYPYYHKAQQGEDVAMELPDLADLGNDVIAVVAGSNKAYVNGEIVTMSAVAQNASSGAVFTDASVPGDFLTKYMGVSGVSADGLHSILRYATGRNILVDSRGLIVLTKDVTLDAEDDVKLLTLLYGYLVTGELTYNYAAAPAWTQSIVDEAVASLDIAWCEANNHNFPALKSRTALYYMVLAAHMDPEITATDGTVVADEAAARLKRLVSGGREPYASAGTNWEHAVTSSTILLAKNTPVIWEQMTEDDIERFDLLMECLGIAANWGYNKDNNYGSGFTLNGNFHKTYGANFRNSYFTCYLSAAMYFGAEKLDEIFVNFDYDSYIERINKAGFVNIKYAWTTVDTLGVSIGEYMTNGGEIILNNPSKSMGGNNGGGNYQVGDAAGSGVGVKIPFAFEDQEDGRVYKAGDYLDMFIDNVELTYQWIVMSSNQAPGSMFHAYILSGAKSPWEGQMGMMTEFSSGIDRSKARYCYLSAVNIAPLYANLKLLGYWDYDSQTPEMAQKMLEMDNRIYVGTEDLFFKINEGYLGCSQMVQVEEWEYQFNQELGAAYIKDIFMNFHFMKNDEISMATEEEVVVLKDPAEPKDGITEAPEGAIVAKSLDYGGFYVTDYYAPFDGMGYTSGNLSFDIVIDDELVNTDFSGVIAIDKRYPGKTYRQSPMLIQFNDGMINFMSESSYKPTGIWFGENYRFHVDIQFDCAIGKYSGTLTQVWPETEKPITASFTDYDFRTSASCSFVDALMPVNESGYSGFWLENVQISGDSMIPPAIDDRVELKVETNLDAIPANLRPEEIKVYLVMNGWKSSRTVTLTAKDGWAAKVFDNLPAILNDEEVNWSIAIDTEVPKYYSTIVKESTGSYFIRWADYKYFYNNDFENWNKGEYVSANTPIYDSEGNILQDRVSEKKSEILQGVEADGNHFLKFNGSMESQATLSVGNNLATSVYSISMKLKPGAAEESTGLLNVSYRYTKDGKSVPSNFLSLNNNMLKVGGYEFGALSAEEWTEVTVILDFNTGLGEVFCGESAFRKTFELEAPLDQPLNFWAAAGSNIWVDDLVVYTDTVIRVEKPADEANKEAEIIIPATPPAQLNPSYKWYYSADFEYWNKGAYVKGNTPITDAYGNVMIDKWGDEKGPLVRGEEANGNHYLELDSVKAMQGVINVDEAFDDGTYIVKWRMKLKDANSVVATTLFTYRYGDFQGDRFATIDSIRTNVCGVNLGALTADEWLEVMVVLNFNDLVGTVCDWEGNKLGSMELKQITSNVFTIYASGGTQGLCIDDLQIFSGNVTIIEPEAPPALDPNFEWFYSNDFENGKVVAGDGNKGITDPYGNIFSDNGDSYRTVLDGENTVLAIQSTADGQQALVWTNTHEALPTILAVKMKMKVDADTSFAQHNISFRYRRGDANTVIARMLGQKMIISNATGDDTPDMIQWTDVELILNSQTGMCIYRIGEAEGTFTITQSELGLQGFMIRIESANTNGLYIDDLKIYTGDIETTLPPAEEEPTTPPAGGEGEDPITPPAGGEGEDPITPPVGGDEPQTVDLTVTVTWRHNQSPAHPESVAVSLYKDGLLQETAVVTEAEEWKCTFADLPKYDDQNREITYTVAVENLPDGYLSGVTGTNIDMIYTDIKLTLEVVSEADAIPD